MVYPSAIMTQPKAFLYAGLGAFAFVLECVPAELAARITEERSIPSIAVRIPTNKVIPIATIRAVKTERSILALMDRIPSFIFSIKFIGFVTKFILQYVDLHTLNVTPEPVFI